MNNQDIEIRNLKKSFGGKTVLSGFSCRFPYGKVTCIMGPSGCGKTTLLHIIAGLLAPEEGTVTGVPEKISMVFQENRLCKDFTAFANVHMVSEDEAAILRGFEQLGMKDAVHEKVNDLSGGMKRRTAILRAVMSENDLILLDEPFKGLDEELKKEAAGLLLRTGKTMIMITHDEKEAELMKAPVIRLPYAES